MPGDLSSVTLKIERARSYLDAIYDALQAFIESAFEEAFSYREPDTGAEVLKLGEIRHPDPSLSLIIGDFLHNVRSALDNLAFQLVLWPVADGGPKTPEDKIALPITSGPDAFQAAKWKIKGAAPGVETEVERLQPHNRGEPYLWFLQELNNWDKHRLLHLTENELIRVGFAHEDLLEVAEVRPPGKLEDNAILARWKIKPGLDPNVDVGLYLGTQVTFEEGDAAGWQVYGTLSGMLIFAEEAIERLAPFIDHGAPPAA